MAGVVERLLQSHHQFIEMLPAPCPRLGLASYIFTF